MLNARIPEPPRRFRSFVKRIRRLATWMLLTPVLCGAAFALAQADEVTAEAGTRPAGAARVSYVTSASLYVDAGSEDGIVVGQMLEVIRDGVVVATLEVTYVSSHRALCVRKTGEIEITAGDEVRFAPAAGGSAAAPVPVTGAVVEGTPPAQVPAGSQPRRTSGAGVHGRIGVRYLVVRDRMSGSAGFSQPALDLFLDGRSIGGSPFDVTADIRSRRTYRNDVAGGASTEDLTAVYRLSAAWQAQGSPWRAAAGRMFSPSLAAVNIFDGGMVEYRAARFSAGLFSGTQPEDGDLSYSSEIREHGGFMEWRNAPGSVKRWSLGTGLVGSYEQNEVNREFGFVQGTYAGARLFLWLGEEVDLNRGWKEEIEGSSTTFTSTYLNVRYRLSQAWELAGGYDNRRNVRLYRDRITPETEFDDQYRTGGWAGVTCRFANHFSVGVDARSSTGGDIGGADSVTLNLSADRLSRVSLDVRTRSTRYTNENLDGWLNSLSVGVPIGDRWRIEATGGVRDETGVTDPALDRTLTWYGLDLDVSLGRHWFLWTSWEHSDGDLEAQDQAYMSVAYRF